MSIEEIYKTISEYGITEENVLDFILQGKPGDSCHFYFRCMLLQLMHHVEHFDKIIDLYYRTEMRRPSECSSNTYNISTDGKVEKKEYTKTMRESDDKKLVVYSGFERGSNDEFKKIIEWAITIIKEFEGIKRGDERLSEPMYDFQYFKSWEHETEESIRNCEKKENGDSQSQREKYTTKLLKQSLEMDLVHIKQMGEDSRQNLEKAFLSLGLKTLWNECISRYEYYNEEMAMTGLLFWDECALYKIIRFFDLFKKDLYESSKIVQNQANVLAVMRSGASFEKVCEVIRTEMNRYNPEIEVGLRDGIMTGGFGRFLTIYSTPPEKLPEAYKKLSDEYNEVMNEQDKEKFIRLCADFSFNFIKVHPFSDGNGRTSRILLSTMLASRDIFFPSLYSDQKDKEEFLKRGNGIVRTNDYTITEKDIFKRLGYFLPIILPGAEKDEESSTK